MPNFFIPYPNFGIVNGETANIRDFPYPISIWYRWHNFKCGGIIIAAHCVDKGYESIYIRAGSSTNDVGGRCFETKNVILNPGYNSYYADSDDDIALIELQETIVYDETMQPIDFPDQNFILRVKQMVTISGYGSTTFDGKSTIQLKKASFSVVDKDHCRESYIHVPDDVFCVVDRKLTKCYSVDHPIIGCEQFKCFYQPKIEFKQYPSGHAPGAIRCAAYKLDRSKPKMYQTFDLLFDYDIYSDFMLYALSEITAPVDDKE